MISPMTDLVRAVLGHVDRQELIDLAGALIRIPSFKTEETPVALFLEAFFRRRGYDVDLQEIEPGRFQTIATLRGTGGGASLMLNEIGRASCREKSVDIGGRRIIKKKKKRK